MFWTFGVIDIKTTVVYCLAQTLGAFVGAAGVYFFYIGELMRLFRNSLAIAVHGNAAR